MIANPFTVRVFRGAAMPRRTSWDNVFPIVIERGFRGPFDN